MSITKDLIEKSNGLLKVEPEISDWTGKSFQMFNTGSVEVEVAEFLYAMVRVTKPSRILDTGTHFGVSALYMAQACRDNGFGNVLTCEIDGFYVEKAKQLWINCGLSDLITVHHGDASNVDPEKKFDFMLLDTEPNIRFKELVKFYSQLSPGSFVFIHDLHRHMSQQPHEMYFGWPFGKLPDEIEEWVRVDKLRPIHFPTPRGFLGLYKTQEDDYAWKKS